MRTISLLLCAALMGLAVAQFRRPQNFFRRPQNFFRPQQNFQRRPPQNFQRRPPQNFQRRPPQQTFQQRPQQQQGGGLYYSWVDRPGQKFTWQQANGECNARGMRLVSLDSPGKNADVVNRIEQGRVAYIWTGGKRERNTNFVWSNGRPVGNFGWSKTGGRGRPQPDNREGDEFCLAILNRFYDGDGVTWHDVSCHHTKPFVCEPKN